MFEDFQPEGDDSGLTVAKARQAQGHPNWMKANVPEVSGAEILPVLVTSATHMTAGCVPQLQGVGFWSLADYRAWAQIVLATVRDVRVKGFAFTGAPVDAAGEV